MRKTILVLLVLAFLASCRINAENSVTNTEAATQTNKTIEVQPVISPTAPVTTILNIDSKVGAVENMDKHFKHDGERFICLTTQNSTLKSGDKIQVILTKTPQQVLQAEISEKLKESCSGIERIGNSSDISSYSLKLSENDESKIYSLKHAGQNLALSVQDFQ